MASTVIHHMATSVQTNEEDHNSYPTRWFHSVGWLLFNVAASVSLIVSTIYWSVLFPGQGNAESSNNDTKDTWEMQNIEIDVVLHSINSILSLLDVFFSAMPVQLFHAIYVMLAGIVYGVFSVIYWAAGGTNTYNHKEYIYPILDYGGRPTVAAVTLVVSILVVVPLVQLLLYGFYNLRKKLVRRFYPGYYPDKVATQSNGLAQELAEMGDE